MSTPSFKRSTSEAFQGFHRPHFDCFACNDTGILHNSDGLLDRRLPLYDRLADGCRLAGSDLALICHCPAAFPRYAGEKTARGGFRQSSGEIHRLEDGRSIGAETPEALMRDLHAHRLAGWLATERAMAEARDQRSTGQPEARPWFLAELRALVEEQAKQRDRSTAPVGGGLHSIGDCLATTLGSPERRPALQSDEVAAQKAELQAVLQAAQQGHSATDGP